MYDLYLDISILLDGLVCGIADYFFSQRAQSSVLLISDKAGEA